MQLGTRWSVGATPPSGLPAEVTAAIAEVEAELAQLPDVDASSWRWTLTWLEGKPVAELDDGTIVRQSHGGAVTVTRDED